MVNHFNLPFCQSGPSFPQVELCTHEYYSNELTEFVGRFQRLGVLPCGSKFLGSHLGNISEYQEILFSKTRSISFVMPFVYSLILFNLSKYSSMHK